MMNRKSQAALEFIMTYGWAILVVLVAVGALAYFGVLSPDRFLPSKCVLQSGLACIEHKVDNAIGANQIQLRIQNSLGQDLVGVVAYINAPNCDANSGAAQTLSNGGTNTFNFNCGAAITVTKFSGTLNVTYNISGGSGISHANIGEITARVE